MEEDDKVKQVTKVTNTTSEKYIAQKFHREFERIVHDMYSDIEAYLEPNNNAHEGSTDLKLNYIRFKEVLLRLGMINELSLSAQIESSEGALILELWQLLRPDTESSLDQIPEDIKLKDAKHAIMAILRMEVKD